MVELLDLEGNKRAKLTLYGVLEFDDKLVAYGYLLRAPKAKRIPDPSVSQLSTFFRPTIPKPLRKGCVFQYGKDKYKCLESLQVDKLMFYPRMMEETVVLEKVS